MLVAERILGGFNNAYKNTTYASDNCLSDFNGVGNTKKIITLATSQSNWRTSSYIYNYDTSGYYPSACACARYKTVGTKAFIDCTDSEISRRYWILVYAIGSEKADIYLLAWQT